MRRLLFILVLFLSQFYFSQSDCNTAIPVCGNSNFSYTPTGHGTVNEDLGGCLVSDEHFSVWYSFTIATSGTLTFTIHPNVFEDDYDFAVYGPNAVCGSLGAPIRCNYSGDDGDTGLTLDLTGQDTDDAWSAYMDVVAGETYYLVVDNYLSTANGFSLAWGGTANISSPFTDPTLTPFPFVPPGQPSATPNQPNEIARCVLPTTFNFNSLTSGILNGNAAFVITYHNTINDAITGDNPITSPATITATTYYYRVKYQDPINPDNPLNKCFQTGSFKFVLGDIKPTNATLLACNNNAAGTASFNLTLAAVYSDPGATRKYYPTQADLTAGTNAITNTTNYISGEKTVYVKVTTAEGCTGTAEIALKFHPVVVVRDASIESCFIDTAVTTASFNLTAVNVTSQTGITKKFYTTFANAVSGVNEITTPLAYVSASGDVYVKVISTNDCYAIAKITLKVLPPVKSNMLTDKTICMEDTTTLDAGPGFDGYEWSTGATTSSISNVPVGSYWVKLKTGPCFTLQQVKVYASQQPVITSIDITNDSFTVNVNGGKSPYKYSLDGINWQDSNVFTGLPRGENKVFVKDAFDCTPIDVQVTVPNLLNAITPNGDNINDYIDYSALGYKKNLTFIVYDRYGNKLYEADKIRNYKWDGTSGGKKIITGTYWYTISWNENDKNNTPTSYTGWILVKNRE